MKPYADFSGLHIYVMCSLWIRFIQGSRQGTREHDTWSLAVKIQCFIYDFHCFCVSLPVRLMQLPLAKHSKEDFMLEESESDLCPVHSRDRLQWALMSDGGTNSL